jgi:CRP-like cAMP-binding protein
MALDDTIAVMARVPILGLFGADALRILAFSADTRRAAAGELLFRKGERSDGGYVVLSGSVAVGRDDGREPAEMILGPGSLIGRTALFARLQRSSTAIAREDATLLRISPTLMRRVLQEFPEVAARMRDALADDMAELADGLAAVQRTLDELDSRAGASP